MSQASARRASALLAATALVAASVVASEPSPAPRPEELRRALDLAADYLVGTVRPNGMFVYRVNLNPAVKVKPAYNILRHAGSIYALCDYQALAPSERVLAAITTTAAYLRDVVVGPVPGHDFLAAWSDPEVAGSDDPLMAKLGGNGITLVALLSVEQVAPGFTPRETLRRLGRFVAFMQKPDGSFYSLYVPEDGGRSEPWVSLYYPGEAALGLLMLDELEPSPLWRDTALRALAYLARSRAGSDTVPADHWALLATERLFARADLAQLEVSRDALVAHTAQVCQSILADQVTSHPHPIRLGGFSRDGRVTPTTTRLEGLQAALNVLPAEHPLRPQVEAAVARGLAFVLRAQVVEGPFAGAFPAAVEPSMEDTKAGRKFTRRATEVRIDYVQHAMSAILRALRASEQRAVPAAG